MPGHEPHRKTSAALALAILVTVLGPVVVIGQSGGAGTGGEVVEELRYVWSLGGYKGLLARLIVPGSGDAVLRTTALTEGGLLNELHITSPSSQRGEFWLYASEVESPECARLTSAKTAQLFRGRAKERLAEIEEDGVLDIPSMICRLRRRPPERDLETRIWSDGRVYPVRISGPEPGREGVARRILIGWLQLRPQVRKPAQTSRRSGM